MASLVWVSLAVWLRYSAPGLWQRRAYPLATGGQSLGHAKGALCRTSRTPCR